MPATSTPCSCWTPRHVLGIGLANLLHLYAPKRIVVGGGLGSALDLMATRITATIEREAMPAYCATPVVPAALGARAGVVGAASLVFEAAHARTDLRQAMIPSSARMARLSGKITVSSHPSSIPK
ncbi:ROK family protein [Methylobrevis pamukkalensis]|uniref:ROK family protein n=1 Tax=Methylobrevis pamukkalensis TaxID=1439726 RepID=A0A1E3H0V7_9HYPH|nr:hypothetical protein A6302_02736 [Methylobrevis pamukkalensis]